MAIRQEIIKDVFRNAIISNLYTWAQTKGAKTRVENIEDFRKILDRILLLAESFYEYNKELDNLTKNINNEINNAVELYNKLIEFYNRVSVTKNGLENSIIGKCIIHRAILEELHRRKVIFKRKMPKLEKAWKPLKSLWDKYGHAASLYARSILFIPSNTYAELKRINKMRRDFYKRYKELIKKYPNPLNNNLIIELAEEDVFEVPVNMRMPSKEKYEYQIGLEHFNETNLKGALNFYVNDLINYLIKIKERVQKIAGKIMAYKEIIDMCDDAYEKIKEMNSQLVNVHKAEKCHKELLKEYQNIYK